MIRRMRMILGSTILSLQLVFSYGAAFAYEESYVEEAYSLKEEQKVQYETEESEFPVNEEVPEAEEPETEEETERQEEATESITESEEAEDQTESADIEEAESETFEISDGIEDDGVVEEPQIETETEAESITELVTEPETEAVTEMAPETEAESETESETEITDLGLLKEQMFLAATANLTPSGSSVTTKAGWTKVTDSSVFSSEFRPLKFYPGVSSMEYFVHAGGVVQGKTEKGLTFLYPTKDGLQGTFGAIYHNVLYYDHKWYDLKMTVADYTTSVKNREGTTTKSFPYIAMETDRIGWKFQSALGGIVLKCELINSETGSPEAVNTRFQWWDIDGNQCFGIKPLSGQISGRYYYEGSEVYTQTGAAVAKVTGMELVIGPETVSDYTDPQFCISYELRGCSSYYMSIGPKDHLENPACSLSDQMLKDYNSALSQGNYSIARLEEALRQTDTSLGILDTPAPVKQVSEDQTEWKDEVKLSDPADTFWCQIEAFVPWQDVDSYYSDFQIKDVLKEELAFCGEIQVIREEDQMDVSDRFVLSEDGQTILASARGDILKSESFYGYHYCLRFLTSLRPDQMTPAVTETTAVYRSDNQATLLYRHGGESEFRKKESNPVTILAVKNREEQKAPVKSFDHNEERTEKLILSRGDEILYTVFQEIPDQGQLFLPQSIVLEDELQECLEYIDSEVEYKRKGETGYSKADHFEVTVYENQVRISVGFQDHMQGAVLCYQIRCRLDGDCNLNPWIRKEENGTNWYVIPNQARVIFCWNQDGTDQTVKQTNTVNAKLRENTICLTKEIRAKDIVWEHGDPTFSFEVKGKDLYGAEHIYYRSIVFTREDVSGDTCRKSCSISVPAGTYTAQEESVMRYRPEQIKEISGGTKQGEQVSFDLSKGGDGSAVFVNSCISDRAGSDTALVRNTIG